MTEEVTENKGFPRKAMGVFIAVLTAVAVYELLTPDVGLSTGEDTGILVADGLLALIAGIIWSLIALSIQYAFIKLPTQWLSKEEFVYKNEIWEAIFYSSTVGTVISFLVRLFGFETNLLISIVVSILTSGLFLFIYFSGREKEAHIKRAITIVQIIWIVVGIGLGSTLNVLFADMIV